MPQSCKTPPKWQIFPPRRQPMPSRHDWRMRSYLPSAAASRTFSDRKLTNAYLKRRPLFRSQIFKFCCDIQGSHLIGYLWVSLIIDQSECLICYFLFIELTLFCTELPKNCIYLNQSWLSNLFMYIIMSEIILVISNRAYNFGPNCTSVRSITITYIFRGGGVSTHLYKHMKSTVILTAI